MAGETGRSRVKGAAAPEAVVAEGLGRRYGRRTALTGVTFRVAAGETLGVFGPDGAGKTTLLQMLAGILDPSEGRCEVFGHDSVREAAAVNARVGYLSQGFTLYGRLSVAENLSFAASLRGVEGAVLAERQRHLLAMAGLADVLDRREQDLSGGMRKKLALCASLIHEPPLLLLDELSLGVDPLSRRELWRMLAEYRRRGAAVVVTTSYMDEADRCDRVLLLDRGEVAALGTPAGLRARCEGLVHELSTTHTPRAAQAALAALPGVIGTRWRPPDRIRFQLARPASRDVTLAIGRVGTPARVVPSFEDVFTILTRREGDGPEGSAPEVRAAASPVRSVPSVAGPVVRARGLVRRFGTFTAVRDVSFEIAAGEIFGFLGPNGAGKTTVIRMLCGLLAPTAGEASVAGLALGTHPAMLRERIGYMSQRFSLYAELSVAENLAFFAAAYGLRGRAARDAMGWAVSATALSGVEDRRVADLSGALRQRLALACSILHRPAVLFLDEPTSGVDPLSRARFWQLIGALAADGGMAALVSTHYLDEASFCHRLALMDRGRLIALGELAALRAGLDGIHSESVDDIFLAYIARARGEPGGHLAAVS